MLKRIAIILLFLLGLGVGLALIFCFVFFILPTIPHRVNLPSGHYLRSSSVYQEQSSVYDPLNLPAAEGLTALVLDREGEKVTLNFSSGQSLSVALGTGGRVQACENHYLVEYIKLDAVDLQIDGVIFHEPILMVACEMWAIGEKVRPAKMILFDGPLPESSDLFQGISCSNKEACLSFGRAFGTLHAIVADSNTGNTLPGAVSVFENELGVQTFTGEFELPLYAGVQYNYRISAAGLPDRVGRLANSYDTKVFIDTVHPQGAAQGYSQIIEMPDYGKTLDFIFLMDWNGQPTIAPWPTSTPLPTAPGTATPVPY